MDQWDGLIKSAKACHTKQAWEQFLFKEEKLISTDHDAKALPEIFRLLSLDPQSKQYDPKIFSVLIKACMACWNLELGLKICEFSSSITHPIRAIPAAQLFLEAGKPAQAREIALKSLRLACLDGNDRRQLQLIICISYVEQGKNLKAARLINKINLGLSLDECSLSDQASTKVQLGRLEFFLGRYEQASSHFQEAANLFLKLEEWEQAAKALFNTAACAQNAGKLPIDSSFAYVEQSRQIAERYDLKGPLSHCEAFYGVDAFQHGNFAEAHEHFRKALDYLPLSDKSYRRLHILSMLALTYLSSGRYHLAKKFGKQTLELAALDKSGRHRSRYISLNAELLWEEGRLIESQEILEEEVSKLHVNGLHTLEELSSFSRYILQCSFLDLSDKIVSKVNMNGQLKKQVFTYLDYQHSLAHEAFTIKETERANRIFQQVFCTAKDTSDKFHQTQALLGQIELLLYQNAQTQELFDLLKEFKILSHRMGLNPLSTKIDIIEASIAYHSGDFKECERALRNAAKSTRISYMDKCSISCWLSTIEGRAFKFSDPLHYQLIAQMTRRYFAPSLHFQENDQVLISKKYEVSLTRYPAICELLHYLAAKSSFEATSEEIQTKVWHQSLNSFGWQQKIRNTLMRIRDLFPYTLAPMIIHQNGVKLFSQAIKIVASKSGAQERRSEMRRLISEKPMTTAQMSKRLNISKATTKRMIQELVEKKQVEMKRDGRNIYYIAQKEGLSD